MKQQVHNEPRNRKSGYTMVELSVASVILVLMLGGIATTVDVVSTSTGEIESRAHVDAAVRTTMSKIAEFARAASTSSLKMTVGGGGTAVAESTDQSWTAPAASTNYDGIQTQGPNNESVAIVFVMDSGETDNDQDDDGDGLIDEGTLYRSNSGGKPVAIASNVEEFQVVYADGAMTVTMTIGVGNHGKGSGTVKRAQVVQTFKLRNS